MIYTETEVAGAFAVDVERFADERGFFAHCFDSDDLKKRGLVGDFILGSISYNHKSGTLRGMHYRAAPHAETKLVRCTRGAVFDVVVDVRPDSPTFKRWAGVELSADNRRSFYIPQGLAHGFLTLTDDSEVTYLLEKPYTPTAERGVRWDDPAFNIRWPREIVVIKDRDRTFPDFAE